MEIRHGPWEVTGHRSRAAKKRIKEDGLEYTSVCALSKLECSKQAIALNTLAWNSTIGLWPILLVCRTGVMIKRDSRGSTLDVEAGEAGRGSRNDLVNQ